MARRKRDFIGKWQENWATWVLGAIIVIILGLLVANFLTRRNQQIDTGEKIDLTRQQEQVTSQKHIVEKDDSLSKIAERFYGDQTYWPVLARVNNIANPNIIFVGLELDIPTKEKASEVREQTTQTSYKVGRGDTLFNIAQKMYGDGSRWITIAKANNLGQLPNGNPLVFADSTIKIPR